MKLQSQLHPVLTFILKSNDICKLQCLIYSNMNLFLEKRIIFGHSACCTTLLLKLIEILQYYWTIGVTFFCLLVRGRN